MSHQPVNEDLHVAFSVSARTLIDYVDPDTGCTVHSLETLDALRDRFPDAEVTASWDAAQRLIEKAFVRTPERIERQQWIQAFDTPRDLVRRGSTETFKSSELLFGDIAVIYARDAWKFYKLYDRADISHEQILAKCCAACA